MTRLLNLTIRVPISFDGEGSTNYFSEPQHRIELDGAVVRIEGRDDVALIPWGDGVARATPFVSSADIQLYPKTLEDKPFLVAAAILTPTIDQKMASQKVRK